MFLLATILPVLMLAIAPLFADLAITPQTGALIGVTALAAWMGGKLLFQKDTEIEARRKAAIDLASVFSQEGFRRLPQFVTNYAVGDYSGMVHEIKSAARDFRDPTVLAAELQAVFDKQLERRIKDPETRQALYDKIEKLKAAFPPAEKPMAISAVPLEAKPT